MRSANLGISFSYNALNKAPHICERAYLPWVDMAVDACLGHLRFRWSGAAPSIFDGGFTLRMK